LLLVLGAAWRFALIRKLSRLIHAATWSQAALTKKTWSRTALSLEAKTGAREAIYAREPKLRDAFLQVLFDHANTGGFKGAFTDSGTMNNLRNALTEIAQKTIGDEINDVLVIDIVRQDVK
jgi:hypothetical protein